MIPKSKQINDYLKHKKQINKTRALMIVKNRHQCKEQANELLLKTNINAEKKNINNC